jgi:ABC-2 type transport system ATP-binding protein
MRRVQGRIKVIELKNELELVELQKKAVVIACTYENSAVRVRLMDENGSFSGEPVAETLEDAYVYCMGGKANG